jgi:sulfite exporter TauE/SafE
MSEGRTMDHAVHLPLLDGLALPLALFLAGLAGGAVHCAGMCGPFVLAQVGQRVIGRKGDYGELRRLRDGALLPYHLGRMTTYALLGAIAGAMAGLFVGATGFRWGLAGLLLAGAFLFLIQAVARAKESFAPWGLDVGRSLGQRLAAMAAPVARDPKGWRGYALGLVLGLLPCGLLYGALAAAAGTGNALAGAVAMAAFALGTMPALIGVGVVGAAFGRRWRGATRAALVPLLLLNAAVLALMAWRAVN